MLDGILTPALRDINYLAPCAPYPMTPSGITVHEDAIYRYAIPTDEQPVLTIIDYIPDYNGNFIKPGHYELALSNDREFLYLIQSFKNLGHIRALVCHVGNADAGKLACHAVIYAAEDMIC